MEFSQFSASGYVRPVESAGACTEWLQHLQLQLGGAFTWATNESEEGFSINNEHFIISGLLGEGSFGSVYRCSCEGHQMAVKILSTERIAMMTNCAQDIVLRRMLQEPEILGCLGGHPNIVQLRCAAVSQETLRIYIVMQLLECSDLFTEMLRRRQPFNERDAREAVSQLVMAVVHCHRRGVAHRDIKLENVMVASVTPFVIKLIDFGQAIMHDQRSEHMRSMAKTLTTTSVYNPPEVKAKAPEDLSYDAFKLDCFAVGVVLYALLMSAWPQTKEPGDFEKHPKWKSLSSPVQDLIRGLLEPDPLKRLSMADALQHPWLCHKGSTATRSSKTPTPMDRETEMQVLLSAQSLNKALQRERGASCWLISGADAENPCIWFRKSTDASFENFEENLSHLQLENSMVDIASQILKLREFTARLRGRCNRRNGDAPDSFLEAFDEVFSGYCKLNEEVIDLIGSLLAGFRGDNLVVTTPEIKIRMLLHIAEQLGRERGFMSFHIGRPELIRSVNAQLRFAKIQGCRQYLVGSSSPYLQCEVVSTANGLLPSLRLADEAILSTSEIQALERAEDSVMQGQKDTAEWFAFLTGMIDKVHQHVSMTVVLFIQDLSTTQSWQENHQSPSISSAPSECGLQSTPSVLGSMRGSPGNLGAGRIASLDADRPAMSVSQAKRTMSPTEKYAALLQAAAILRREEEYIPGLPDLASTSLGGFASVESNGRTMSTMSNMSGLGPPSLLLQKEQTPVKVMPLSTPEATPIHPGIWSQCRQGGVPGGYPISPPNMAFFSAPQMSQMSQCPQVDFMVPPQGPSVPPVPGPVPGVPGVPGVPAFPQASTMPAQTQPRSIVVSKGTIGHPHSCRGLGCKFASKERGCREGADCPRCHLCVWSRASEKEASQAV